MKIRILPKINILLLLFVLLFFVSCGNRNNNNNPTPEPVVTTYTVSFYLEEELFESVVVEENNKVSLEKEIPSKPDSIFDGWYTSNEYVEVFDISTPITSDCSLYGKYTELVYFDHYNGKYLPSYSPLTINNVIHEGDENIELIVSLANDKFNKVVTPKMIVLSGALKELTINEVNVVDNVLHIKTTGQVSSGNASIVLAKEATINGTYIYKDIEVMSHQIGVDPSTITLNLKDHHYFFTVRLKGKEFDNPENLTPDEYLAKHNNKDDAENNYFTVNNDAYSYTITKIHDDWQAFDVRVYSRDLINKERATELRESVIFSVDPRAFKDKVGYDYHLNIEYSLSNVTINVSPTSVFDYEGAYHINLKGCRLTEAFKTNKDNILNNEELNHSIFNLPNAVITIKSMDIKSDTEITGKLSIHTENALNSRVLFHLNKFKINEETIVDSIRSSFDDEIVPLLPTFVGIEFNYDTNSTGTVSQTASSNYSGITNVVDQYAFSDITSDFDSEIAITTDIGKIVGGLVSKDFSMSQYGAGNLLGVDALRNPSFVILESIAAVMDKLNEIEEKIDQLSEKLDEIQAELSQLEQESLLNNFLEAYNAWNAFITDYYTPLLNTISNYSTAYFRYYYDLVVKSIDDELLEKPTLTVYFDSEGKVAYLDESSSNLSIDGRMIDKDKTLVITLPGLIHALTGIMANEGHSYSSIEEDIIFDILSTNQYDDDTVASIIKTLRFNAMKSYFSTQDKLDEYSNAFINFCSALTGSSITSGLQSAFTPLDCFNRILETIFNFGFEAESDLNLIRIKIGSTYYCAKQIVYFVDALTHSQTLAAKYKELDTAVKSEMTSERFYHKNREDGAIYSFAAGTYIKYTLDAVGISVNWKRKSDTSGDFVVKLGRTAPDKFSDDVDNYSGSSFSSIDETTAKLMAVKVKVYNQVKGTNYTFKEYLAKIGMISNNKLSTTYGLALSINGIIDGKSCGSLSYYQQKMHKIDVNHNQMYFEEHKNQDEYTKDMPHKWAIKGSAMSLDDSHIFTGLGALYTDDMGEVSENMVVYLLMETIDYTGIISRNKSYPLYCYTHYLNFFPANN